MNQQFVLSIKLWHILGDFPLPNVAKGNKNDAGTTLKESLRHQGVSLWDMAGTYLILYRFPHLFLKKQKSTWTSIVKSEFRPLFGRAQAFRKSLKWQHQKKIEPKDHEQIRGKDKIVFVGFEPRFFSTNLFPIWQELEASPLIERIAIEELPCHVEKEWKNLHSYWNHDIKLCVKNFISQANSAKNALFNLLYEGSALEQKLQSEHLHISLSTLKRELNWLFNKEIENLARVSFTLYAFLNSVKPQVVITADDASFQCRAINLIAKDLAIPTLLVQQGLAKRGDPEWSFLSCTKIAAMGEQAANELIHHGVPKDSIVTTGNPAYDALMVPAKEIMNDIKSRLQVPEGNKLIVFFSQPYYIYAFHNPHIRQQMIRDFIEMSEKIKNATFVVKPHPSDDLRELNQLFNNSNFKILGPEFKTPDLIRTADVVVTFFSTCALEALYLKKPVINLHYPNSTDNSFFLEGNATWLAKNKEDILQNLKSLAEEKENSIKTKEDSIKNFVRQYTYLSDGLASKRIVSMIGDLMGKSETFMRDIS